jgi:hypothetical protein
MRYAMRKDLNDGEISAAVKAAGFSIIDYTKAGLGIPDKLALRPLPQVGLFGEIIYFVCWLEIKSKSGRLSETQEIARAIWQPRGEWIEAREPEQVVKDLWERYNAKVKPEAMR